MSDSASPQPTEKKNLAKTDISEAVRAEIIRLAIAGDAKHDGAFTAGVARVISRVVKSGHGLLFAERLSAHDAQDMMRRRRRFPVGMGSIYDDELMDSVMSVGSNFGDDDGGGDFPIIQSTGAENFGMTAIREMIAKPKRDLKEIVVALAEAKANGLDDAVKMLEDKLRETLAGPAEKSVTGAIAPTAAEVAA